MTSPFKSSPKISAECNHCEEKFTYNDTYSTGRLCKDCKKKLDDPSRCEYSIEATIDSVTRELHITVSVSHDLPTSVSISPYTVSKHNEDSRMPTHRGAIADLTVSTVNGDVLYRDTWETERQNVLNPHGECSLSISSIHSIGCDSTQTWSVTVDESDVFAEDTVTVNVAFPEIKTTVPESSLTETIDVPSYLIELE